MQLMTGCIGSSLSPPVVYEINTNLFGDDARRRHITGPSAKPRSRAYSRTSVTNVGISQAPPAETNRHSPVLDTSVFTNWVPVQPQLVV